MCGLLCGERKQKRPPKEFLDALCAAACVCHGALTFVPAIGGMEKLEGDDYYKLLGVSRNATEQEINKGRPPRALPFALCTALRIREKRMAAHAKEQQTVRVLVRTDASTRPCIPSPVLSRSVQEARGKVPPRQEPERERAC